jgi:hypothetical protein
MKITKAALEFRVQSLEVVNAKMQEKVALLEAQLKAAVPVVAKFHGRTYAAVALPRQVVDSIWDTVLDCVHKSFGDGHYTSGNYDQGGDYEQEVFADYILPGYAGFIVYGHASRECGFEARKILGYVEIPHACGTCKKPTMGGHNCKECSDTWAAEVEARNAEYAS